MNIYQIDQAILGLVDAETGELLDYEAFEQLQMEKEHKIESMALWVKELEAEANAIGDELSTLSARKRADEKKAESLKAYLDQILDGSKFKTARCAVNFRRSTSLRVDDPYRLVSWLVENGHKECLRLKEPEISKTEVNKLLKDGCEVPYTTIVERRTVGVK